MKILRGTNGTKDGPTTLNVKNTNCNYLENKKKIEMNVPEFFADKHIYATKYIL